MKGIYKITGLVLTYILLTFYSRAQITYTSNNNYTGGWEDGASWNLVGGWNGAPQTPSNPTNSNCNGIDVYGYIKVNTGLTVNNANPVINVYDTLFINGDFDVSSGASLTVHDNGLLIVTGSYTSSGSFSTSSTGKVVIMGDVNINSGTRITTNDQFYIFGSLNNNNGYVGDGTTECYTWGGGCDPTSYTSTENDLNNNDSDLYNFVMSGGLLPIEVINFKAKNKESNIQLSWTTVFEDNFDYFIIERSSDGKAFYKIGSLQGIGNKTTPTDYYWADQNPVSGLNYYRLKAIDFDGFTEYHGLVFVNYESVSLKFDVYPNPVVNQSFNIVASSPIKEASLISSMGNRIKIQIDSELNSHKIELPDNVTRGPYTLKVVFEKGTADKKILVY